MNPLRPEKSVPTAIKQVFWRILLFYILSIFVIACIIPYTSPDLLGSSAKDIAISPFTLVFKRVGLASAGFRDERGHSYGGSVVG